MDIIAGVAHPNAVALPLPKVEGRWSALAGHRVGGTIDGPAVESLFSSIVLGKGHFEGLIRSPGAGTAFGKTPVIPLHFRRCDPRRLSLPTGIFDDYAHAALPIFILQVAEHPNSGMVHVHNGRNTLRRAEPQNRDCRWIRHWVAVQRHDAKH